MEEEQENQIIEIIKQKVDEASEEELQDALEIIENKLKEKPFCLSEKVRELNNDTVFGPGFWFNDVRRFINKTKNDIVENDIYTADEIFRIINENAGEQFK